MHTDAFCPFRLVQDGCQVSPSLRAWLTPACTGTTTRTWPYFGPDGWLALDLEAGPVDWDEVRELADASYRQVAKHALAVGHWQLATSPERSTRAA
jgi:hypothetical protein